MTNTIEETLLNYYETMKCCADPKSMAVVTTEFAEELNTEVQKEMKEFAKWLFSNNVHWSELMVSQYLEALTNEKIDKAINKTVENWNKDNPKLKTLKENK